jgi:hypothetical protein
MGYVLFMFIHRAWLNIHLSSDGFSLNVLGTYYRWPQVTLATYLSCSCTASTRACASARVINCSLIYGRFLFKFAINILQITTSSHGYVLFMITHRAHIQLSLDGFSSNLMGTYYKWLQVTWDTYLCSITACVCERACASASVIKHSLIFERILRFGGDIRQIPIGYMRYLICVWMHVLTARTC